MYKKNIFKIFYIIFFLALFFSKAIAEPTFVQSKSIDAATYYGLTFNNDGTKMYTAHSGGKTDGVVEYILTSAYDISTATLNTSKVVHRGGGNGSHVPTQVVFNNDGTKMFIVNHDGVRTIDYWSLSTAFDISTATFDDEYDAIHFIAECTSATSNIKEVAPHLFLHDQELDNEARKLGVITLRELEENRINNLYN